MQTPAGDALHTTTASETADGGLGDALDVVAEHLAVAPALAASFFFLLFFLNCVKIRARLERLFSIFNATYDDNQKKSHTDYIELSMQSQFNKRGLR
jgi:hypothetical protein